MIEEKCPNIMASVRINLADLEHIKNCETALNTCRRIYLEALPCIPLDEIIRAIERRLPQPRKELAEAVSICTNNDQLIITRPIGELEGRIIYVTQTPNGAYFGSVKTNSRPEIPAWDITSPKTRRSIEA